MTSEEFLLKLQAHAESFAKAVATNEGDWIIKGFSEVISSFDWTFASSDFRQTLESAKPGDLIYADPPYAGRHVDYFNSWSEVDENELACLLKELPCGFILSTWHSNEFRKNARIEQNWNDPRFHILLREHFYHVGSSEDLRHPMIEALITNFPVHATRPKVDEMEQLAFFERPIAIT